MPISAYYEGHGGKVMREMKERYGEKKGKSVFYATASKRGQKPGKKKKRPSARAQAEALND